MPALLLISAYVTRDIRETNAIKVSQSHFAIIDNFSQSIGQSVDQSVNQLINQSINWSVDLSEYRTTENLLLIKQNSHTMDD